MSRQRQATSATDWPAYLAAFHAERAGITEDVFAHAFDSRRATPYEWAAEAVLDATATGALVLDLACGSAPMASRLPGRRYLGLDLSSAELAAADARGVPVARAEASQLPLPTGSVDAVVVSMALMLVPFEPTLRELARVLEPGGVLVATVPNNRPMPPTDWLRYARLCVALRHPGLSYPNDTALAAAAGHFAAAGFGLREDDAVAFVCELTTEQVAEQLLTSLYLPDVAFERMSAGRKVVRRWVGSSIATPVRRLVATC